MTDSFDNTGDSQQTQPKIASRKAAPKPLQIRLVNESSTDCPGSGENKSEIIYMNP